MVHRTFAEAFTDIRWSTCLQVVEMAIQMTTSMTAVYDAIADIMDSCIKELRRSNKIDTTELTLEHGLFKSFDEHVRRQLETVWHTVSPRTKQVPILATCLPILKATMSLA